MGTKPTIADPFLACPNGAGHNAMVVVHAVMADGSEVPRRAICATCRNDWDPSTGKATPPMPPQDDDREWEDPHDYEEEEDD